MQTLEGKLDALTRALDERCAQGTQKITELSAQLGKHEKKLCKHTKTLKMLKDAPNDVAYAHDVIESEIEALREQSRTQDGMLACLPDMSTLAKSVYEQNSAMKEQMDVMDAKTHGLQNRIDQLENFNSDSNLLCTERSACRRTRAR